MKTLLKITLALVVTVVCLIGCVEEQDPQPHAPGSTELKAKQVLDVTPSRGQIK